MQSNFAIPGKCIYNRPASKIKKSGRYASGIGFVIDSNLKCQVNMKLSDRIATATIGNLMVIGVHLIHHDGSAKNELELENQLALIQTLIDSCSAKCIDYLIIGDFNFNDFNILRMSRPVEIMCSNETKDV